MQITEPARQTPVACEVDLCVLGGSCTGVFAAVAAARLGLSVALVEQHGFLGGVATAGLVNIWHKTLSDDGAKTIIAGMTREVLDRLTARDAVLYREPRVWHGSYHLNTEVLKITLDEMVTEAGVRPFLHATFAAPHLEADRPTAAILEDKNGRRAIKARYFIDATGDGDFVHRVPLPTRQGEHVQPPSMCAVFRGLAAIAEQFPEYQTDRFPGLALDRIIFDPRFPQALPEGNAWWNQVPGSTDETMLAGARVFHANCADADDLTAAEIKGRAAVASIADLLREHFFGGQGQPLVTIASHIGIRQTRTCCCLHTITQEELLRGVAFEDAIGYGTYPVDVHHHDRAGITFRWLNGTERTRDAEGHVVESRWLPAGEEPATCYQIPYRALVPQGAENVLVAGRLMDADNAAFGGLRVMVNTNQTGQAAGVAAALAAREGGSVADVDPGALRGALAEQGAVIL